MIGIGVGIDYALFIVTRYRQGLHDGLEPEDAVATAITTSGRAVLLRRLHRGHRPDGHVPDGPVVHQRPGRRRRPRRARHHGRLGDAAARHARLRRPQHRQVRHLPAFHRSAADGRDRRRSGSAGAAGSSAGRGPSPLGALALLLVLAFPVTHLRLGIPDAGNDPKGTTTRNAYDLLSPGFGPGLQRAAHRRRPACPSRPTWPWCSAWTRRCEHDPGVASVGPVVPNNPDRSHGGHHLGDPRRVAAGAPDRDAACATSAATSSPRPWPAPT